MENTEKKTYESEELDFEQLEKITGGSNPPNINIMAPANCPYCPMGFSSVIFRDQHIDIVHPDHKRIN